jgi:hypothetical protein
MLKNPSGQCRLKKWIYTQTAPLTLSRSKFHFQGSALTQGCCLLLLYPASIDTIAAPLALPPPLPHPSPCRRHCRVAIAALFYVVVLLLSSMEISSVYRVSKYYSNVEYSSHRLHAKFNFCVRSLTFF